MENAIQLTVSFDRNWIFKDYGIHSSIVKKLERDIKKKWFDEVDILQSTMCECKIRYTGDLTNEKFKSDLCEIIQTLIAQTDAQSVCSIVFDDQGNSGTDDPQAADFPDRAWMERIRHARTAGKINADPDDTRGLRADSDEDTSHQVQPDSIAPNEPEADLSEAAEQEASEVSESAFMKIQSMTASRDFKQLAQDITISAPGILRDHTLPVFFSEAYLLCADTGSGIHTTLSLLSDLLKETRLTKESLNVEWISLPSMNDREITEKMRSTVNTLEYALKGNNLLCIDISDWIGHTHSPDFKKLLLKIARENNSCLIVFRMPYVKSDIIEQTVNDISDLVSVRPIVYAPFSSDELRELARKQLKKFNFDLVSEAWPLFDAKIEAEKADGYFYGAHTVQKVIGSIIRKKELLCGRDEKQTKEISADVIRETEQTQQPDTDPLARLRAMVGMEDIAARVEEIINMILYARQSGIQSRPAMHMCFIGNPGTGKTTVARIIGEILKEKGVLRIGKFYEHHGRDLCGEYVGQTAPKTRQICQEAYGSVLFIDEAYSLAVEDSRNDYGREAIDTLIAEMENNRDDLLVILAGYPDDIEKLLNLNPGMRSRVPYTLAFRSYRADDLSKIFMSMVKNSFNYADDFENHTMEYFNSIPQDTLQDKQFGNGRFIRNLFERVWSKALARSGNDDFGSIQLTCADFDAAAAEFDLIPKNSSRRIGFGD